MSSLTIREATEDDLLAILHIYNEAIEHTTATYDLVPVSLASRQEWFTQRKLSHFPVLVAEQSGIVIGYASYGTFRPLAGYAKTVEHSIYLSQQYRGQGIGERLLRELIKYAKAAELHVMVGGIDGSNEASLRFHERLGFKEVARMPEVGRKFGRWLELVFVQLILDQDTLC